MLVSAVPAMAGEIVSVNMTVESGSVEITTKGFDHTTWHPNQVGETNSFTGMGNFSGTYTANEGTYGILNSFINVNSGPRGAYFQMVDVQDFNVMSGNHINNVVGYFRATAYGTDDQVAMNLKSIGSMYVWSEATDPYWAPPLRGNMIEKEVWTTQNGDLQSRLYLGVTTNGIATMYNSNIWGWTNGELGSSSTNYGGGTRTVTATGSGSLLQYGFGRDYLEFNGVVLPGGGSAMFTATFNSGLTGTYSMTAN